MKKFFVLFIACLFSVSIFAEQNNQKGFITDGFWEDWELSFNLGLNYTAWHGLGFKQGDLGDNIGFHGAISASKWLTPVFGGRLEVMAAQLKTSDEANNTAKGVAIMPHIDILANLTNWIKGYEADRKYNLIFFGGFGGNFLNPEKWTSGAGFIMDGGLVNRFRANKNLSFDLELKGILAPGRDMLYPADRVTLVYAVSAGLTYRLKNRGWERAINPSELKALQDQLASSNAAIAAATADNARLAQQLADAEAAARRAQEEAANAAKNAQPQKVSETANLILFNMGSTLLSSAEKVRLDLIAEEIKAGDSNAKYELKGYADKGTGSAARNDYLSKQRAKRVYDYLVAKGVNKDQLSYEGMGGVDSHKNGAADRAAKIQ